MFNNKFKINIFKLIYNLLSFHAFIKLIYQFIIYYYDINSIFNRNTIFEAKITQ